MSKHPQPRSIDFPANVPILLDDRPVDYISAFLFNSRNNDDPKPLIANAGKSFQGSIVLGMGFTFDDTNPAATPIAEMQRLIEKDPRNQERIFPYIGGEEVNGSPTHSYHRYVINFGEMSEEEARQWPDLMAIVEEKVKPERQKLGGNPDAMRRKNKWWLWGRYTPALFKAITQCDRVLVIAQTSNSISFAFQNAQKVFSHTLVVFPHDSYSLFTCLQNSLHQMWALFFAAKMKDDARYIPSDCFLTFPFPKDWETNAELEAIGKTYYHDRAELMVRNNQGLTDTYNRFHSPHETDPEILHLRQLHHNLDAAVLAAYGWADLAPTCGFGLDYLDADLDELPPEARNLLPPSGELWWPDAATAAQFDTLAKTGRRKLPWRYRWPEAQRDELLARLLDLNQKRYDEEIQLGLHAKKSKGKSPKTPRKTNPATNPLLFDID